MFIANKIFKIMNKTLIFNKFILSYICLRGRQIKKKKQKKIAKGENVNKHYGLSYVITMNVLNKNDLKNYIYVFVTMDIIS